MVWPEQDGVPPRDNRYFTNRSAMSCQDHLQRVLRYRPAFELTGKENFSLGQAQGLRRGTDSPFSPSHPSLQAQRLFSRYKAKVYTRPMEN